jgi:HPt (histidine-containing phosphotransfer) domain-containing protein
VSGPTVRVDESGWQPGVIDQLRLELGDDDGSMIAEIISLYLDQGRDLIEQLTAASDADNEGQLRSLAHSLKGSTLAVGGTRLAELCQGLEAGVFVTPPMAPRLDAVYEEFDRLAASLSAPVSGEDPRTVAKVSSAPSPTSGAVHHHDGNRA